MSAKSKTIRRLEELTNQDVALVGGKNASLGEMIRTLKAEGVQVPDGFATTAAAYRIFLQDNDLDEKIRLRLEEYRKGEKTLHQTGEAIRRMIRRGTWPEELAVAVREAYGELCRRSGREEIDVAVRSSATAEDLPDASFAGQQETFLNISGEAELLDACRKCYASLFTDRAISYRENKGFDHLQVALSVGVQKMVRSDQAGAGVMFSIDTDTGFPHVVVIDAAWGLGENVVQGTVNPDAYLVFKPLLDKPGMTPILRKSLGSKEKKMVYARSAGQTTRNVDTTAKERRGFVLSNDEILQLARWAVAIEKHYGRPMDMEWAKDGETGELFIVQARPETVQSRKDAGVLTSYALKESGKVLLTGLAIGEAIAAGRVQVIKSASEIERFEEGGILVTGMTDPDWVPIMKKAAGIITDHGGRTSHAAIVSRELGIAAVIGTGSATSDLKDGQEITLSCAEGDQGKIYEGILDFEETEVNLDDLPEIKTQIMLNIASPAAAFRWWRLPCRGIGLARMEFIINNLIQAHPMALLKYDELEDKEARQRIRELTKNYDDKSEYFVDQLAQGIAVIAASQYPDPVIVRMSDFKTNEYADLIGGRQFEFSEENPMLGFRGASRYYSEHYRAGFALECAAIRRVREAMGLTNLVVMIPFCRTLKEADRVLEVLAENGLVRGQQGLEVYVMVEIPSNVILAEQFAERFDGFSIGSNDLTQLTLGVDRDSAILKELFDERDPAVMATIAQVIRAANKTGTKIGICGQAPSDYPEFAAFLVEEGIDSISLNPDSVIGIIRRLAQVEKRVRR
ncbi:phosphoenolpyruvate synthase [Geoalkalibacter halelectricus]|uniref:Phosphoenolpyruvate synthase n=1 Tax=Geoalkalibacter halelectricus TaxID=2847045 RepID=A0ABY5ZTQ9_9BACT|nr:phosphoenolpyruvate synthase [Geoalkalibacter halelectricus]MDO3376739.1 phosphoenolpyruvate synthase [Geoalkalibacter halelectricus]UWZ81310.1 phosphoenolpyruvate synthase [Geoalkalibacter halelectricus]